MDPRQAAVAAFLDLDELLRRVATYASESAGTEASSILLHDAETQEFVVAATGGPAGEAMRGRRFPDSSGVAGAVLKSGQPCILSGNQADLDRSLSDVDHVAGAIVRSVMAAPLRSDGRTLGVVEAVNRIDGGPFGATDLERFVTCCSLIAVAVENASLYRRLHTETEILKRSLEDADRPLVAESPAMRHAVAQAERAAAGRSTVLLLGETGTGKEQLARRIHEASPRARKPFVTLNCGALPESLIESELFGHEKGAFTGADHRASSAASSSRTAARCSSTRLAISPRRCRSSCCACCRSARSTRVGGTQSIAVNVRMIAATHRDLPRKCARAAFAKTSSSVSTWSPIRLPPLRDRPEDLAPLAELFLGRFARELGRPTRTVSPDGMARLLAHRWPGNVRELENLFERLMVLGDDTPIDARELVGLLSDHAPPGVRLAGGQTPETPVIGDLSLWEQEHALLVQALERSGQNQTHAARALKISREQLRTRMKRYGLLPSKEAGH